MFQFLKNLFNKKDFIVDEDKNEYDPLTIACMLAHEVARSDGDVSESELNLIKELILINNRDDSEKILNKVSEFSNENTSFYDFVKKINENFSIEEKENLISVLWDVAFADGILETHEERLIRRIADLIFIKDIRVLKLKHQSKKLITNKTRII